MNSTKRTLKITNSPKCYRFKPEAFENHAPQEPGIYELVSFDEQGNAVVLFVGLALQESVYEALYKHENGSSEPKAANLFMTLPNLYFDMVYPLNATSKQDLIDIHSWLLHKHKPRFNIQAPDTTASSPDEFEVMEVEAEPADCRPRP